MQPVNTVDEFDKSETITTAPLSLVQEQLWLFEQLDPERTLEMGALALRMRGPLDVEILDRCLQEIIQRHEILRTILPVVDGNPVQRILANVPISLTPSIDLSSYPESEHEAALLRTVQELAEQECDLSQGPLIHFKLIHLKEDHHVLQITAHHTIFDGTSVTIIVRELKALYEAYLNGQESPLSDPDLQYADFAEWERQLLESGILDEDIQYWTEHLTGAPPILELPGNYRRPPLKGSEGWRERFPLGDHLISGLQELSKQVGGGIFVPILTGFAALVYRYTGRTDFVLGTLTANRPRPELEGMVGQFANTLPIRLNLSGDPTLSVLLERCRDLFFAAYDHQHVAFEKLVETYQPQRDAAHTALVQHLFAIRPSVVPFKALANLEVESVDIPRSRGRFDMIIEVVVGSDRLHVWIEYDTQIYTSESISQLARHYDRVLEILVHSPHLKLSQIPILDEQELASLLPVTKQSDFSDQTIVKQWQAAARHYGEQLAVLTKNNKVTYRILQEGSNRIAHHVAALNLQPETRIGIYLPPSTSYITTLLAALQLDALYVPLNLDFSSEQLSRVLEDCNINIVITTTELCETFAGNRVQIVCLDQLSAESKADNYITSRDSAAPATILYPSSCRNPDAGLLIESKSIMAQVEASSSLLNLTRNDRIVQLAEFRPNISPSLVLAALVNGAAFAISDQEVIQSPESLCTYLVENQITIVSLSPKLLSWLQPDLLPHLRIILISAALVSPEVAQTWKDAGCRLFSVYGETHETTTGIFVSEYGNENGTLPTIKSIFSNYQPLVLDNDMQVVPPGVTGHLYIDSTVIAFGYLKQAAHIAGRFVPNPFSPVSGSRLYKTAYLARWTQNHKLEFLGHEEQQLNILGLHVSPLEVEALLAAHPQIAEVAVVLAEEETTPAFVAYIVPLEAHLETRSLQKFLSLKIPYYMVPATFYFVSSLPRNIDGTVAQSAIVPLENEFVDTDTALSSLEAFLIDVWSVLFERDQINPMDDFFRLGGHSMLVARLVQEIRENLQIDLTFRTVFENPTVAKLAEAIDRTYPGMEQALSELAQMPDEVFSELLATVESDEKATDSAMVRGSTVPLSYSQQQFWVMEQISQNKTVYTIPLVFKIYGPLDVDNLREAINDIVARHESLRTTFSLVDETPIQEILPERILEVPLFDLSDLPVADRETHAQELIKDAGYHTFDLTQESLLFTQIIRTAADKHWLILNFHHLITDEISMGIFVQELSEFYKAKLAGRTPQLPPLRLQYPDYALWERKWLKGGNLERLERFWRRQLLHVPILNIPTDHPRPPKLNFKGDFLERDAPRSLFDGIVALAKQQQTTAFTVLMAATAELIYRLNQQDDFVIGVPSENRNLPGSELLIGSFLNVVPVRIDRSGEPTLVEFLRQIRDALLDAYYHQALPISKIIEAAGIQRRPDRMPLVQVSCELQLVDWMSLDLPDCKNEYEFVTHGTARYEMAFHGLAKTDCLTLALELNKSLWKESTGYQLLANLEAGLSEIIADPTKPLSMYRFQPTA